jgi:hypothetical protein
MHTHETHVLDAIAREVPGIRGIYGGLPLTSSTCVFEEGEATSLGTREVSLIREDDCVLEGEDVLQKIHSIE